MLRPATPLTICFFIAFVLLLLSVLSTPIIKQVPLASFRGVDFGVFGYCEPNQCSGFTVGYETDTLFSQSTNDNDWSLPSSTRTSLSSILIVHPVAALLALVCTGLAAASHFHGPSHSPRYLLVLLLLTFPTLLVSLLAFLVDILLFIPHMAWGGWIVLAATIVITIGIVMTCAMRRTLVSRRARKNRINENPDMNGENFYGNRSAPSGPTPGLIQSMPKAESPPLLSTGRTLVNSDKNEFATFELQQKKSDDRQPLNPTRSNSSGDESGRYYGERGPPGPANRSRQPPRDQFGNPLPPGAYGQPLRHQTSNGTIGSQGSMGPPPAGWFRGRVGPRGGQRGGPPRGGFGPRGGFRGGTQGMRGPPPPGWNGGRGGMAPGPPMGRGGHRGPPPVYESNQYGNQQPGREISPGPYSGARDISPQREYYDEGPIGQAIEMDAVNGVVPPRSPNNPNYGLRDSDGDVQGMIGLQQQKLGHDNSPQNLVSPTSEYSNRNSEFVPARAGWQQAPAMPQHTNSSGTLPSSSRGLSPIQASPVELPAHLAGSPAFPNQPGSPTHGRKMSADYYEDVDPRFAAQANPTSPPVTTGVPSSQAMPLPTALMPGGYRNNPPPSHQNLAPQQRQLDPSSSYEELAEGARSPAHSDTSHFTSVSQRPVNPNWRPQPGNEFAPGYGGQRKPPQNAVLDANPDFNLPGVVPPGRQRGGSMRGGQDPSPLESQQPPVNVSGVGRYPGPDAI